MLLDSDSQNVELGKLLILIRFIKIIYPNSQKNNFWQDNFPETQGFVIFRLSLWYSSKNWWGYYCWILAFRQVSSIFQVLLFLIKILRWSVENSDIPPVADDEILLVESPVYLSGTTGSYPVEKIAHIIKKNVPNAKFLVILCDPAKRLYSHLKHMTISQGKKVRYFIFST